MTATFSNVVRGVAIGDAWGAGNEFQSIGSLTKNNPRGPELPALLDVTDDTQMTLFLADALDLAVEEDLDEQGTKDAIIAAFLDYYTDRDTNSRAPGITVMGSLGRLARNNANWQEATNKTSDGSGTVMRTSPVAFVAEDRWVGTAAFAAAVTHGAANGIAAAILNVAVLRRILQGLTTPGNLVWRALEMADNPAKYGLLDTGTWLDGYEVPGGLESGFAELARLLTIALDALPGLQADPWGKGSDPSLLITSKAKGGGWRSHETLVIALLSIDMLPDSPMNALRRSVTTDGDSDTIGAVAGGLLGAAYPGVFEDLWNDGLRDRFEPRYIRWIEDEADDYGLAPVVQARPWYKKLLRSK